MHGLYHTHSRKKIETELDRLVKNGVYQQVSHSKWAAPIVTVIKEDGTVRMCGYYKLTVNKVANADKYPVPKTEDLLVKMNGRRIFCKLDLSNAYQQLVLDFVNQRGCNSESILLLLFFREKWKNVLVIYHDWLFELMTYLLQEKTLKTY